MKIPFFEGCVEIHTPLVLKGLKYAKGKIYGSISMYRIFNSILGQFFQSKFPQAGFFIILLQNEFFFIKDLARMVYG